MKKILLIFTVLFAMPAGAQTIATPRGTTNAALMGDIAPMPSDYMTPVAFNQMEPFLTNEMRERLRPPGTYRAPDTSALWSQRIRDVNVAPASDFSRGRTDSPTFNANHPTQRRVVARSATTPTQIQNNVARAAAPSQMAMAPQIRGNTAPGGTPNVVARSATAGPMQNTGQPRRVVARSGTRLDQSIHQQRNQNIVAQNQFVADMSGRQCLAAYTTCMDGYCRREGTPYNRCFCSPRLAQIDDRFQPAIHSALERIVALQSGGNIPDGMTDKELEEFWKMTFAAGAWGGTALADLNAALNINWADMDSRVRGQNAFNVGHEFCVQQLQACFYMAGNLRDVYRSEISRDCAAYESHLNRLKNTAESAVALLGG